MDPLFRIWAVKWFDEDWKDPDVRRRVMYNLKFQPDVIEDLLLHSYNTLSEIYMAKTGRVISQDFTNDPPDLLRALQKFYAKELAEIIQ